MSIRGKNEYGLILCNLKELLFIFRCDKDSVQFNHSVLSNFLRCHALQHARPPCPSPTPEVYSNSCPLRRWCHPTISSSFVPFSFCFQSFPVPASFPISPLCIGGQSIGALATVLMNIQGRFPLVLTGLISLLSKGLSRVFSTTIRRHQFFSSQPFLWSNSHICTWLLEKPKHWL